MRAASAKLSISRSPCPRLKTKRPCDRCHAVKEKCRWPGNDADVCERCLRLTHSCQTNRPLSRKGRKPKLATGNRLQLQKSRPSPPTTLQTFIPDPPDTPHKKPSPPSTKLVQIPCQWNEPEIPQTVALFPQLSQLEIHFLEIVIFKQMEVDKYLICSSFRDLHQQSFASHLQAGMPLLTDAFIACASTLAGNEGLEQLAQRQKIGYKRAASAISALRFAKISNDRDLSTILILGVALVTFALHHPGSSLPLCRHILNQVKSLFNSDDSLAQRLGPNSTAFLICLLGTETEDCLIQCRVPSLRIRWDHLGQFIDRFIGVSAPMLTYFYDICEVAQRIRLSGSRQGRRLLDMATEDQLEKIEQALEQWEPTVNANFLAKGFTTTEVTLMMSQAKILRLTALLITLRLRYAFGIKDDAALVMSDTILNELDAVVQLAGRSIPFAELAFLVACLEIKSPVERQAALAKSHMIVNFSPHLLGVHKTKLVSFWALIDHSKTSSIYWENLGSDFATMVDS